MRSSSRHECGRTHRQFAIFPRVLAAPVIVSFFRSTGGALGVALFGALFNTLLRNRVGTSVALGEGSSFSPGSTRDLPPIERAESIAAFADSLTPVFLCAAPLALLGVVLMSLLHEEPLRSTTHAVEPGRELASASACGIADTASYAGPMH